MPPKLPAPNKPVYRIVGHTPYGDLLNMGLLTNRDNAIRRFNAIKSELDKLPPGGWYDEPTKGNFTKLRWSKDTTYHLLELTATILATTKE